MAMSEEQFKEWKQDWRTEEVFSHLKEYRKNWVEKSPLRNSAEETLKEAALQKGVLLGLDALLEMEVADE